MVGLRYGVLQGKLVTCLAPHHFDAISVSLVGCLLQFAGARLALRLFVFAWFRACLVADGALVVPQACKAVIEWDEEKW